MVNKFCHKWGKKLKGWMTDSRRPTILNFSWFITGIYFSRSVHLSRIVQKLGWDIQLNSGTRRFTRVLMNKTIQVRKIYGPIAELLLVTQAKTTGEIRLLVDGTRVGLNHQLLMVSIAFRRRSIPIAWTWVKHKKGHSSARVQKALLSYVRGLIPAGVPVSIAGDAEFGNMPFVSTVAGWGWKYTLRQKASYLVKLDGQEEWQRLGDLATKPGQSRWLGKCLVTEAHAFPTNLHIEWRKGEANPWLLATNYETPRETHKTYKRRMWIEEMFGDLKSNGFDLEITHLIHFQRLSRLTLAVSLLYAWMVDIGSRAIKNSERYKVDRRDRRDYSIFRIGYNTTERLLGLGKIPLLNLSPYFR